MPSLIELALDGSNNADEIRDVAKELLSTKIETMDELARIKAELEFQRALLEKERLRTSQLKKENEKLKKTLEEKDAEIQRLDKLAHEDLLTGVLNRRGLNRELPKHLKNDSIVFALDIDYFKRVNDKHDHEGGDEVLKGFAKTLEDETKLILQKILREEDTIIQSPIQLAAQNNNKTPKSTIARIGGEEFIVVTEVRNKKHAHAIANRLRKAIEGTKIHFNGHEISITSSIGYTPLSEDFRTSLRQADKYLYQAKKIGARNRVVGSLTGEENPTIYARRANPSRPYPQRTPNTRRQPPMIKEPK